MARRATWLVAAGAVLALVPLTAARAATGPATYADSSYRAHDLENVQRSLERQTSELTTPGWDMALTTTGAESALTSLSRQVADLPQDRLHATLGAVLPGGAVGQPQDYQAGSYRSVTFLARTGAKLYGRVWGTEGAGAKPGVVITTGSIQATQEMYWWFARTLAAHGYEVLTFDVQGQGESETAGHAFGSILPTTAGVPFQQAANFEEGTIDALRFFESTPSHPYRPLPRTDGDVAAAKAQAAADGEHLDWVNPGANVLDHSRLGIVGHSLGASAVSAVQQCSDQGQVWKIVVLCQHTAFPIRAVIAWDRLSASNIVPVVPALDEEADGYFLNPEPSPTAPDPGAHLTAERAWAKAGVDTMTFTVRGGVHTEWAVYPLISLGTAYGTMMANYYSLAWFDRYVKGDPMATGRILAGPTARDPRLPQPNDVAWNAHHFSVRYLSAWHLHDGAKLVDATDLRRVAKLSPVADWAGANADAIGAYDPPAAVGHGDGATGLGG